MRPPIVTVVLACLAVLVLAVVGVPRARAGQWVASPPQPAVSGYRAVGGDCAGHVTATGDRLLAFDTWSGSWNARDLNGPHPLVRLLAGGQVLLFVAEDLAVAFDAADQEFHEQPLAGTLVDTGFSRPSFACGDQLAVVVTDQAMHVYDATRDAWQTLTNSVPYPHGHFETRAEPDLAYCELRRQDGIAVNLAYSRRTGTFARAEPGLPAISSSYLLDHGFAGFTAVGDPTVGAIGYSAMTGGFTYQDIAGASSGILPVDRERRALSHLWGYGWQEVQDQNAWFHLHTYDTLTGSWSHHVRSYTYGDFGARTDPVIGGRLLSTTLRASDPAYHYDVALLRGRGHTLSWTGLELQGAHLWPLAGGSVLGWGEDRADTDPRWLCFSSEQPQGLLFQTQRPELGRRRAGEDWLLFVAYDPDAALMDVHVYHGAHHEVVTTQTWANADADPPDLDGRYAYLFPVWGEDHDVIFYSSVRHELAHHHYPEGTWVAQYLSDHLALTYTSAAGNALYDPHTGVIHCRPCDYGNDNLGACCVIGEDQATATLHAYSVLTGAWSTQPAGGDCYDTCGDRLAVGYRTDASAYFAFNAEDGTWATLEPASGSGSTPQVGGRTALVVTGDVLHAYWPQTWTGVADEGAGGGPGAADRDRDTAGPGAATLTAALARLRCGPTPFNARLTVTWELPRSADVHAEVFDVRGHSVARLARGLRPAGPVRLVWDTADAPSGTYLVRIAADDAVEIRKVVLVR